MGSCKRKHPVLLQLCQDSRGGCNPLNGIGASKHLINNAKKGFLFFAFLQNPLQGFYFHNEIAFPAFYVVS